MELFKLFGTILINNEKANAEIYDTEKAAKAAAKELEELSAQAGEVALAVGAAAAAFVAGIGVKAVMAADDLKKSMNLLQAQTGASDADMRKFKDSAMELYEANVGQSFDDIARAMGEISRTTGMSGEELEATTKNAIALRDTFDMGVNESARTANSLMKQFGISSKDAYEIMAQSAQQGANKNGDLLDTLNEYSGMFKAAGYTAEEFGNILIQGAKDGAWSIDKVGDAVKESNIRLKDGSKTSREAVEGLGLSYDQIAGDFSKGGELAAKAYNMVVTNLSKIEDPLKKNDLAVKLFGTQFEDLETTILGTLTNAGDHIDLTKGSLDKINDVKYDSVGQAFQGIWRNIETNFFIPLGEKMLPAIESLIKTMTEAGPEIKATLGGAIDFLAGLFNGLVKSVEFVVKHFKIFLPVLAGVVAMMTAQFVIGTLIPMYKAWRVTTAGMAVAQALLNKVVAMNPFVRLAMIIGVVITAIVLLIMNWDSVVKYLGKAWKWITDIFDKSLKWTTNAVKKSFDGMMNAIVGTWDKIKSAAKSVWDWIMNFFSGRFGKIAAIFMGPIGIGLMIIANWQKIKDKAISIWNAITDFIGNAIGRIKDVFQSLRSSMVSLFDGIWSFIKTPINLIIKGLNLFIKGYENLLNNVIGAINSIPDIKAPKWLGGKEFGIPDLDKVSFPQIPGLAEGGTITKAGTVMVGEQGPEFLNLPRGAEVVPLDKQQQQPIVININDPKVFNEKDAEKLGDLLVRALKFKGIAPRGV